MTRRWTQEEIAIVVRLTRKQATADKIAQRLERSYDSIIYMRRRLHRQGRITLVSHGNRTWTREENSRLEELLEAGYGYEEIGRRLHRPTIGVYQQAVARSMTITCTGTTLGVKECARLVGVTERVIAFWMHQGWLPAINATPNKRYAYWRITHEALEQFLQQPDCFMAWDAERITDPILRAWAIQIRSRHPHWLTTAEVGSRLFLAQNSVLHRIVRGELPATQYRRRWYVRECDIETFVIPSEAPRKAA